jgi:multiple sugar transport system substrate-binding protein
MHQKRRLFIVSLVIGAILATLLPTVSAQDTVHLVFRQNDPPNQIGDSLQAGIDEWNANNPNIQVELETVPWNDAQNQYVREVQAGGGPDVLQLAFVWTRDLAKAGLVMNLDSYLEADPPGKGMDDFLGVDLGVYDGSIYGVPWSVDTFVMAYRPDLFEEAGIESFPDTWDDLLEAARALTHDGQYGFCFQAGSGPTGGMWFLANYYLWSNGKFFVHDENGDGTYEVGTTVEDVKGAMDYFNTYFKENLTPESMIAIDSWGDPEYTSSLGNGQCAIIFVPPAAFSAAQEQSEMPLLTAPDPRGSVQRISHLGGRTLAINPNTEHPDEAYQFLKFLTTQEFYENYYSSYFPPQISLLDQVEFPEALQGYAEQLPYAITFNEYIQAPPPVQSMWESTNREFGAVYSGQKSTQKAAEDLVARMHELLEQSS